MSLQIIRADSNGLILQEGYITDLVIQNVERIGKGIVLNISVQAKIPK